MILLAIALSVASTAKWYDPAAFERRDAADIAAMYQAAPLVHPHPCGGNMICSDAIGVTSTPLRDDGFGKCPAFSHWHSPEAMFAVNLPRTQHDVDWDVAYSMSGDSLCHRDDNDAVIPAPPDPAKDMQ